MRKKILHLITRNTCTFIKKTLLPFLLFLLVGGFSSCKSSKNIVYLNNTSDHEFLNGLPGKFTNYKIKANDN